MLKRLTVLALSGLTLAGCGTLPLTQGSTTNRFRAFDATPIVDLTGVPTGVSLKLSGKYQKFNLTGNGTINALDTAHLAVSAHVVAHWAFISQAKDVTFSLALTQDPTWPYAIDAENVTDNQSYTHKASLVSRTAGNCSFKLDDGTTAVISTNGKGLAQIVYGDFNLAIGNQSSLLRLIPVANPVSREHFFN